MVSGVGDGSFASRRRNATPPALVVGYGSSLRGDDAVGQRVVLELQRQRDRTSTLASAHFVVAECLTPELAEDLAGAGVAVFVDAACDGRPAGEVTVHPVAASDVATAAGPEGVAAGGCWEDLRPEALLGLACCLYEGAPPAFVVSVGIGRTPVGEELSAPVEAAVAKAVLVAEEILETWEGRR
jgi:hydrogenase maturation protease